MTTGRRMMVHTNPAEEADMLNLTVPLAVTLSVILAVAVCGGILAAITLDRLTPTPTRHRPDPETPSLSDEPDPEPAPKPFDPLDEHTPLADVEHFLACLLPRELEPAQ